MLGAGLVSGVGELDVCLSWDQQVYQETVSCFRGILTSSLLRSLRMLLMRLVLAMSCSGELFLSISNS